MRKVSNKRCDMSRADEIFIANCKDILTNGVWDTELEVRPRWADGAPA